MAWRHNFHLRYSDVARFYSTGVTRATGISDCSTIKRSVLATDHFQRSLPSLKVPILENTIDRYLGSQEALLDSEQFNRTKTAATGFLKRRGPALQKTLMEYAHTNRHTSYITRMWFDMYLSDRRPVVITHNPTIVFKNTERGTGYDRPSIRATNLLYGMLRFANLLRSNSLEPEIFHLNPTKSNTPFFHQSMRFVPKSIATYAAYLFNAYPLDMSQYSNMFNATRIPKPQKDELFCNPSAKHVAVIHRGQTYIFGLFDDQGNTISARKLLANLEFIMTQPSLSKAPGVGTITTMSRDVAFAARQRFISLGNTLNLGLMDAAFITLVLDEADSSKPQDVVHNFLTGPSESRWFDKSVTLLVDRCGQAAINFEHSWGDGVAVVRLCNDIYANAEANPAVGPEDLPQASSSRTSVQRLEWLIDDRTSTELLHPARLAYNRRRNALTFSHALITDGLCKRLCKLVGLSPDAMMQLAFQMAYDRVHGIPAATYESCSTAAFKHGRTETIRSATVETRNCVRLFRRSLRNIVSSGSSTMPARNAVTEEELFSALVSCSTKHNSLTKQAAMGQGWDRHLFALHHFALLEQATGFSLPEIFLDDSYMHINRIILSTSTLSSPAFAMGGFAPTQYDGYGIAYAIHDDHCGVMVSSWRDTPTANANDFTQAFRDSTNCMTRVIQDRIAHMR